MLYSFSVSVMVTIHVALDSMQGFQGLMTVFPEQML